MLELLVEVEVSCVGNNRDHEVAPHLTFIAPGGEQQTLIAPGRGERIVRPAATQVPALHKSNGNTVFRVRFEIDNPQLWYPSGYGPQNMYTVEVHLIHLVPDSSHTIELDTKTVRIGFRHVTLVQEDLEESHSHPVSGGRTFYLKVNGIPIFVGGSNWIPADSFLPRVSKEKLRKVLKTLAHDVGKQNMLRVWGGGIYESDDFYDLCDELGLMVWQDVCLACGDYPANDPQWEQSIEEELRYQISERGLAHRASLVVWAGSNEDYQVADEELGYDHNLEPGENGKNWKESRFPSRWLYERRFPALIAEEYGISGDEVGGFDATGNQRNEGLKGRIVYWPGSPWGGEDSTDRTVGDLHQWNVWGGVGAPYQRYAELGGRFNSEFGFPSYPALSTILKSFLPNSPLSLEAALTHPEFHPQSFSSEHHQKAHSFEKRFDAYLAENLRGSFSSYKEYVHLSQLLQAEAMDYAYRGWRKLWGGNHLTGEKGRLCGGALAWQLNDVWPVTSWSLTDYYANPKPALYAIGRAMAPISFGISRTTTPDPKPNGKIEALVANKTVRRAMAGGKFALHSTPHIYPPQTRTIHVWLANSTTKEIKLAEKGWKVVIQVFDINKGSEMHQKEIDDLTLVVNGTTPVWEDESPAPAPQTDVVSVRLVDKDNQTVVRYTNWPQPLKHHDFHSDSMQPSIIKKVADVEQWDGTGKPPVAVVKIQVDRPVKGFVMEEVEGIVWGEGQGSDVVPGDVLQISALWDVDEGTAQLAEGVDKPTARHHVLNQVKSAGWWHYGKRE